MAIGYSARVLEAYLATYSGGATWWNPDGATPGGVGGTCVAAYQPKGAASYAASKVNLANPGTNDAAEGIAPTWAAGTGWTFNGTTQYLISGIIPTTTYSVLCRFSGIVAGATAALFGVNAGITWLIYPWWTDNLIYFFNNGSDTDVGTVGAGVLGFAGKTSYIDGLPVGVITGEAGAAVAEVYIGAYNNNPAPNRFFNRSIQAIVFYSVTLTAPQFLARATAMAAL